MQAAPFCSHSLTTDSDKTLKPVEVVFFAYIDAQVALLRQLFSFVRPVREENTIFLIENLASEIHLKIADPDVGFGGTSSKGSIY
jgi:hypothetical protein